jgi:DNA helicase HerA-like ATPase
MDGSEVAKAPRAPAKRAPGQIGVVTSVSGFKLSCLIFGPSTPDGTDAAYMTAQIGALVKVPTLSSSAFGFIDKLNFEYAGTDVQIAIAEIDLLGELTGRASDRSAQFTRGISIYPVLGAPVFTATGEDIKLIYAKPNSWTLQIGSLHQDADTPAYLMSQEFLSKHSAIVGTTGSGKSCALTLILRTLLTAHPNGHVVMLDPHGEYATAFDDIAEVITPDTLQLPYWLLSFEEIVEVLCSTDPAARSREAPILKEIIVGAKQDFLGAGVNTTGITVDTPTPYRLTGVLQRISDAMGKLDRPDSSLPYLRLMTTIENLRKDPRYDFMFEGLTVRDNMTEIISLLLRIPVSGKPITILDISAVPSEIVNVVVSVLARLIFDFALHSERTEAIPILLVCDEAHRYIPRDESQSFEGTRRSISRIAKEGRKYGVSLCLVTQRPSELSESILSQCSTIFALRMNNERDQKYVRSMLPDDAAGLLNVLPTLRQREAIVVGEGVAHPMRIRFSDLAPNHRPKGEAANFPEAWQNDVKNRDFITKIVERWRHQ